MLHAFGPPVVDHHFVLYIRCRIQPCQKVLYFINIFRVSAISVRPKQVRLIISNQLLTLRKQMLLHIAVHPSAHAQRTVPLYHGIIQPHSQPLAADSFSKLSHKVSSRADIHTVPRPPEIACSLLAWPQCIAVVMLCGKHHILGSCFLKQFRPLYRVVVQSFEHGCKIGIALLSIHFFVIFIHLITLKIPISKKVLLVRPMLIPFGIRTFRRPSRHRIQSPMDKYPELGIAEP